MEGNKLKITLTDTEVICCFGAYEKLFSMSPKTKTVIKLLLNDIIEEHYGFLNNKKISAEIRGGKNIGCIIILSSPIAKQKEYLLGFENSEGLIEGVKILHRILRKKNYRSSLYKAYGRYYLFICNNLDKRRFSLLRNFSYSITSDCIKIEEIKEYGIPITKRNAVNKMHHAFFKET